VKACIHSMAIVNITLCILTCVMLWMGMYHLPVQLNAEMTSEVMLDKYSLVCARLTATMTGLCLLAIVVIDVALIRMYRLLKQNVPPAAGGETSPEGEPANS